MFRTSRIYLPVTMLLIASMACAAPGTATPDANVISTFAAQTVIAGLTQNAPVETLSPTLEVTPTLTFTPTETSTPTETPTPIIIFTATLTVPLISVSTPTNCRNGPGKVYVRVGALLVGESAEVYGRDPTNQYWYIRNPDPGPEFCWAWGEYATLVGPILMLPIFTPPPTPTPTMTPTPAPAFAAEYSSKDTCNTNWWVELKLKNTGPISFKSVNISVTDKDTNVEVVSLADGFVNIDGCLKTTTKDTLASGDTYLLSAPPFAYDPAGHNLRVKITLCSETGQKGMCITVNKIDFKP
ncbi:MAG: hypothetical protein H7Y59_02835 [Anaerolineales bacterium]|nr:hypothetical protein [Anaerolineales bacterium]